MPGLGALHSRASTYNFGDWNKCGELMRLAPHLADGTLQVPALDRRFQTALRDGLRRLGSRSREAPAHRAAGRHLQRRRRHGDGERTARVKH